MDQGERLAEAARGFLGTPFRLHGRNRETGLDCVGLVIASLEEIGVGAQSPAGYALRNHNIDRWLGCARRAGFESANSGLRAGDVLLVQPGPCQHHLMIAENSLTAIHAHAGLRRVVRQPVAPGMAIAAHWRLPH